MRKVSPINRETHALDTLNVIAKISFGGELHVRSTEEKRNYKGPLFEATAGDLVISKIRVAQGSLCLVPDNLAHLAVSPEYPVYAIDLAKARAKFVQLAVRTSAFQRRISGLRSGNTTKARIRPAQFEALYIPIPPLNEQDALTAAYTDALARAAQLEQEADAIERAGWLAFEEALGLAPPPPLPDAPVFVARFKDMEQWTGKWGESSELASRYPLLPLSKVLIARREPVEIDGALGDWQAITIKFSGEVLPRNRTDAFKGAMFAAYPGDIVFSKIDARNGAVGLIPDSIPQAVVTSEYPVFTPKADKVRAAYLSRLLRAEHFRNALQRKASGTSGRKRITPKGFLSLVIPVPPLAEQDVLVSALSHAARLKQQAASLRQSAWEQFEAALFVTTNLL